MKMMLLKVRKQINLFSKKSFLINNRRITALVISIIILLLAATYLVFFRHRPCIFEYTIKPVSNFEEIQVIISIQKIKPNEIFELYKGDIKYLEAKCYDYKSNKIEFNEKGNLVEIHNENESSIRFTYTIKLGQLDKHGHRGGLYTDLLTFDGGEVLILPADAFSIDQKDIKVSVGKISIGYDIPKNWVSIVPFSKVTGLENKTITELSYPAWSDIYDLGKSCFAFGKFKKYSYENGNGMLEVFIDSANNFSYTDEVRGGLNSIYKYYANLFGRDINFSILLLRKDVNDGLYIIGGSSTQTLGATFDPDKARDWQLMGHRFFHAFFDTAVRRTTFHDAPQLWFYEGLATYYENMSMSSLPSSIRERVGLDVSEDFLTLFKQYLYMREKDKYFFSFTPMDEEKFKNYKGITEFLHYTQAPLVIKAIDDIGYLKYGEHDRLLKYILSNSEKQDLGLNELIQYAIGDESNSFINTYMNTNELLPMWYLGDGKVENTQKTLQGLNDIEYSQWTWFRLLDAEYPLDTLSDKGLQILSHEAVEAGVHFAPEVTETEIKKLSPMLYALLQQYALRAKVCGIDIDDKMLRYELIGNEVNLEKWKVFKGKLKIN